MIQWNDDYEIRPLSPWDDVDSLDEYSDMYDDNQNVTINNSDIIISCNDNNSSTNGMKTIQVPRSFERIHLNINQKQKNIDYDVVEKAIEKVLKISTTKELTFFSIYNAIQKILPTQNKNEATPHFCFVALLVLCNKCGYKLLNKEDYNDVVVIL
ncbi:hypothetical protein QTN25_009816 [Entamoeba marina]